MKTASVRCHCGAVIDFPRSAVGKEYVCRECRRRFILPPPPKPKMTTGAWLVVAAVFAIVGILLLSAVLKAVR